MTSSTNLAALEDAPGPWECSLVVRENGLGNTNFKSKNQEPSRTLKPASAVRLGLTRELFAESITIAIEFGLNSLRAAQHGDDEATIGEFLGFHAAARTAAACARELRDIAEGGAP
jgi:hypothetical protein